MRFRVNGEVDATGSFVELEKISRGTTRSGTLAVQLETREE